MKAKSSDRREVLAWKKRVRESESKVSVAVDDETQTHERNTELAVRFAGVDTQCSRFTDARACLVACMDGLETDVKAIVVWMGDVKDNMRLDLTTLIQDGPCAACEKLLSLAVSNFTAASVVTFAASGAGSVPAS